MERLKGKKSMRQKLDINSAGVWGSKMPHHLEMYK